MAIRDLVPWKWGNEKQVPVRRENDNPMVALQHNIDRLFDDFFRGTSLTPFGESWSGFTPRIDVTENDQAYMVSAELPGLDENDVQVSLANNILTISGEKKEEKEDKGQNYYRLERAYGSFQRNIPLPPGLKTDQVDATFKKGVLTILLPKAAEARRQAKRIPAKTR
ncbi:MAG: Hsp20/alpha crystallin family protein [Anaerolineae bacterium]|nr:Hsp20/alpha crystallin family protein [Anaerolineae bacterium]